MKTKKPYVVLTAYTPAELEKKIAAHLAAGYSVAGGVSKGWGCYSQAVFLPAVNPA